MSDQDVKIIAGPIPWSSEFGAIDERLCPRGWEQALAKSDKFGWRLSLYTEDAFKEKTNGIQEVVSTAGVNEFPILDMENEPDFDVSEIKAPEYTETTFDKTFKKYFGDFEKIENEELALQFEKAKELWDKDQKEEGGKIFRNIALSIYYEEEHKKFVKKSEAHFAGVDFEYFMASDYAALKNDTNTTVEDVLRYMKDYDFGDGKHFSYDEIVKRVSDAEKRLQTIDETYKKYRISGERNSAKYTPERQKLHLKILEELIYDNVEQYLPEDGESPTLILLGGRGGSGKSNFKNLVYDDHFVVLDPDVIKRKLPEYDGWNATEVHEESSDIMEQALLLCQSNGLNVVVDSSMNSSKSVERRLKMFKAKGFQTEAHYTFLPPQKSAQRAVARFLSDGEKGRYMPIDVVLANKTNEQAFDKIKMHVDAWSFYNGDVEWGESPYLLASSENAMSYMEKKKARYLFDLYDKSTSHIDPENKVLSQLDQKIKAKLKEITLGARK